MRIVCLHDMLQWSKPAPAGFKVSAVRLHRELCCWTLRCSPARCGNLRPSWCCSAGTGRRVGCYQVSRLVARSGPGSTGVQMTEAYVAMLYVSWQPVESRVTTSACAAAGQWPLQEAAAGSDSGSDSDAQRPSGSFSDVGACLTSDGGVSPRETTTPPSAAARGFGVAAGTGSSSCHMPSNSSSVAARRRRRRRRRQQQSSSRRHSGSTASGLYLPVVHCGSVRQAARVVAMREVALDDDAALGEAIALCVDLRDIYMLCCGGSSRGGERHRALQLRVASHVSSAYTSCAHCCKLATTGSSLASAVAAAAALLGDGGQGNGVLSSPGASGSIGCATAVTLQFVNRPEWLQAGARLILRDQGDGCAAGAGIVRKLYWGVVPPSARDAAGDCGVKLRPSIDSACSDLQAARL